MDHYLEASQEQPGISWSPQGSLPGLQDSTPLLYPEPVKVFTHSPTLVHQSSF
jgi:hypothetical protein